MSFLCRPRLICLAVLVGLACSAMAQRPRPNDATSPKEAATTEEITKAAQVLKGFGQVDTAQFDRAGRKIFAVWYNPFSGRDACFLHVYYFNYATVRWVRFIDTLVEHNFRLSAEMPEGEDVVVFKGPKGQVAVKESVANLPQKP